MSQATMNDTTRDTEAANAVTDATEPTGETRAALSLNSLPSPRKDSERHFTEADRLAAKHPEVHDGYSPGSARSGMSGVAGLAAMFAIVAGLFGAAMSTTLFEITSPAARAAALFGTLLVSGFVTVFLASLFWWRPRQRQVPREFLDVVRDDA